jgi:CRISPR-associated endonuclease/helicase Cas3
MKNFDKLFFVKLISNSDSYYAHLSKEKNGRRELLSDHLLLTMKYAQTIAERKNLIPIIKELINTLNHGDADERMKEFIWDLFWDAIAYHDLGKINDQFQKDKMKNNLHILEVEHSFGSDHSRISAYLYLAIFYARLKEKPFYDEDATFLCNIALYLSYPIIMHHSSELYECQHEGTWNNEKLHDLSPYISLLNLSAYGLDSTSYDIESFHSIFLDNADFDGYFDRFNEGPKIADHGFPLYILVRLCYSLLTASDYLATTHFMNGWEKMDTNIGVIDDALRNKMIYNAHHSRPYNAEIIRKIDNGENDHSDYAERNNANINGLRCRLGYDIVSTIRKNIRHNLFYIEAPTGSGKTNASMLALAELLAADSSINNIFYVFPFTTLITQTYNSLKTTLELNEGEIAEIHSKAPMNSDCNEDEYLNYLDELFINYPVTLLSHVRFFDILKTNKKESNYVLHRLANSVVIIDELQSYPPSMWDKMMFFISQYAQYLNIRFIIMSATLPKIGELMEGSQKQDNFVYLVPDKNFYFQNKNFSDRVKFDYSLLSWDRPKASKKEYFDNLYKFLEQKSSKYASEESLYRNSVFTIIEFISKRSASMFLQTAQSMNTLFDEIFILSGTILEPRRRQIIEALKSEELRRKKVLLITTQVVEAGVDIDMDLGFKDCSLIDSEEQLAGRINRNVKKDNCVLYLFDCDSEELIYGRDQRYKVARQWRLDNKESYREILQTKDFDKLYRIVLKDIIKKDNSVHIQNIHDLYESVETLDFIDVDNSIKLIDQTSISVFVPLRMSSCLLGNMYKVAEKLGLSDNDEVEGSKVWNLFKSLVMEEDPDFIHKKIKLRQIFSLMSQFIFSIFPNGKDYENLKTYGYEQFGFLYLENYKEIYSFNDGINTSLLQYSNFF